MCAVKIIYISACLNVCFSCVIAHVCGKHAHTCVCVWKLTIGDVLDHSPPCLFRQGLPVEPKAH